jgi:hypothetical protein
MCGHMRSASSNPCTRQNKILSLLLHREQG